MCIAKALGLDCKIYNFFNKEKAQLSPGGVCELPVVQVTSMSLPQGAIVAAFAESPGASLFGSQVSLRRVAQLAQIKPLRSG